jgi:phosphatidylserine/phosphatidylglycerophosphate/cardiolipin synthase-like enzyme
MRQTGSTEGLAGRAIAGSHVVLLGWDIGLEKVKRGLLGFAIHRQDQTENESRWLRGMKMFPGTPAAVGSDASSREQPIQSFQWGDYSAKAGHRYVYSVVPMYGAPGALTEGPALTLAVTTETEGGPGHSIYFNRGAVASQEYARRFHNQKPDVAGPEAYAWLSRGLEESIATFIRRADGASYGLRGAIYEFQWPALLAELRQADERGADVRILYDAIDNAVHDPVAPNEEAIEAAGIGALCTGFVNGKLMHNKFLVLTKDGAAVAVLTGSSNWTPNGLFGHLNCTHVVDNPNVAADYLAYWSELSQDQGSSAMKDWTGGRGHLPLDLPDDSVTAVFSPQSSLSALNAYAHYAGSARKALFATFAFGMNKAFLPAYREKDSVLRFALMEKEGNGAQLAQGKLDIAEIRKLPNVEVALGCNVKVNSFDRWVEEASSAVERANVHWVHTKFMLVDPLGEQPTVITGSANFSGASTSTNEENMLVIRGDQRVADIYLGEFMRSFAHYAFREAVHRFQQQGGAAASWTPQNLAADDAWLDDYFKPGSARALKRRYFAG